ncbi:hypothetical protein [Pseudenhygromyxa sp. WMMC2535]|uniref:hypothetical protein n=1 Tax=Pseudenhygromyxa sp. WMMC2535 TaxID=2712867 RepID=UPI001C3D951C|nr:hypothetical protein [Pseudenhygromyxa sp. WMMC2535]
MERSKLRMMIAGLAVVATLTATATMTGCGTGDDTSGDDESDAPQVAASTRNHLVWKRYHAVEQDLSRALELSTDELCTELGEYNCVQEVHLAGLGGNNPFVQALYEPLSDPLVTTSLALDRIAMSACKARVERDRSAPVVFTKLDLEGDAPAADSEAFTESVDALYRRLLSRDPVAAEYEVLAQLLVDDAGEAVSAASFAHEACFVVATTTEFLFL